MSANTGSAEFELLGSVFMTMVTHSRGPNVGRSGRSGQTDSREWSHPIAIREILLRQGLRQTEDKQRPESGTRAVRSAGIGGRPSARRENQRRAAGLHPENWRLLMKPDGVGDVAHPWK
jgi:hypothetical protein